MAEEPPADAGSSEPRASDGERTRHGDGHELAVAALLDPDLPDDERAAAEGLVRTCPACADLHADLRSLAEATRQLQARPRPRDFRLTAADAQGLSPAGEPHGVATRLTGDMQVSQADHGTHDPLLVASLLDRPTDHGERPRAEALLAACGQCAALHRDLVDLRAATRSLPTPPRVRDYAISAEDARRLRRIGWRRLLAAFGSTRDAFSRPLAVGLTTIGLAGLLVTAVPGALPGAASPAALPTIGGATGGAAADANAQSIEGAKLAPAASAASSAGPAAAAPVAAAPGAPSAAPSAAAAVQPGAEPAPSAESFDTFLAAPSPGAAGAAGVAAAPADSADRDGVARTSSLSVGEDGSSVDRQLVAILAGLLLASGIGLFLLRWAGRRV